MSAARVRVLAPEQIADGLKDRFRLLTGSSRTAAPRQQTLQASVDWSYSTLTEPERMVLARVSVFAGGFTLEGAEAVSTTWYPGYPGGRWPTNSWLPGRYRNAVEFTRRAGPRAPHDR